MEEIRLLLEWLRPEEDFVDVSRRTHLAGELHLSSCEWLGLVAMIESMTGRILSWERDLCTVGDLLDYLAAQGIELEDGHCS